jgi:hypothetical protein
MNGNFVYEPAVRLLLVKGVIWPVVLIQQFSAR